MITKETAAKILNAHLEIEKANKLLEDLKERITADAERNKPTLYNALGEKRGLMLGVPSGDNSHQLFNVSLDLSYKIIVEHIESQQKRLEELGTIAKIELYS